MQNYRLVSRSGAQRFVRAPGPKEALATIIRMEGHDTGWQVKEHDHPVSNPIVDWKVHYGREPTYKVVHEDGTDFIGISLGVIKSLRAAGTPVTSYLHDSVDKEVRLVLGEHEQTAADILTMMSSAHGYDCKLVVSVYIANHGHICSTREAIAVAKKLLPKCNVYPIDMPVGDMLVFAETLDTMSTICSIESMIGESRKHHRRVVEDVRESIIKMLEECKDD